MALGRCRPAAASPSRTKPQGVPGRDRRMVADPTRLKSNGNLFRLSDRNAISRKRDAVRSDHDGHDDHNAPARERMVQNIMVAAATKRAVDFITITPTSLHSIFQFSSANKNLAHNDEGED